MTTFQAFRSELMTRCAAIIEQRNGAVEELAAIHRTNPRGIEDPDLARRAGEIRSRKENLNAELENLRDRLRSLNDEEELDKETTRLQAEVHPTGVARSLGTSTTMVRVGAEAHTYQRHDPERSFLRDLFQAQLQGDPDAMARLARHGQEMQVDGRISERAITSGGVAAFVPPAYLQHEWAELVRAGRPTANLCRSLPLPATGMTVYIPKVSTGSSTAVQSTENTGVSETNMDDTQVSAPVVTIAGQQTLSRQLFERSDPAMDEVVFADLANAYAVSLDDQVLNGSGSPVTGFLSTSGINAVTAGTATLAALWPKLADALQRVTGTRYAAPEAWVMHPRRWGWFLSQVDDQNRPLVVPNGHGPQNAAGVGTGSMTAYDDGSVGTMLGLPVYLDASIPINLGSGTNEDRILLARFSDSILLEENGGAPNLLRFEQTSAPSLGVLLVAYGYAAFTAARQPKGISVLSGAALVTPTF